jgi:hypothetical protein
MWLKRFFSTGRRYKIAAIAGKFGSSFKRRIHGIRFNQDSTGPSSGGEIGIE